MVHLLNSNVVCEGYYADRRVKHLAPIFASICFKSQLVMRRQWETEDLIDQWTLHAEERALLGNKTGATRLGFAVLLKYFQRTGRFPQHNNEVPGIVISYLATQVEVDAAAYLQYDWQGRTIEYHRAQIRAALGFREASVADGETMSQWLAEHVLPHEHQEDMVRQSCYQHFRLEHIEPPKPDRVRPQINSRTCGAANQVIWYILLEQILTRMTEMKHVLLKRDIAISTRHRKRRYV